MIVITFSLNIYQRTVLLTNCGQRTTRQGYHDIKIVNLNLNGCIKCTDLQHLKMYRKLLFNCVDWLEKLYCTREEFHPELML